MIALPQPDNAESRMAVTLFVVEATSFEQHTLWGEYAHTSGHRRFDSLKWEQISMGWSIHVGDLGKMPCYISVTWACIENQLVMFWYPTSEVSDIRKANKWISKYFSGRWDDDSRVATCDAMNFHHCVQAIKEKNELLPTVTVEL